MKTRIYQDNEGAALIFWCPGCKMLHSFQIGRWRWNGDLEKPSLTPSLLCDRDSPQYRCHLYLTAGVLHFLSDCHHDLAGTYVELPDLPDWATQ